jgi:hypothetical protein
MPGQLNAGVARGRGIATWVGWCGSSRYSALLLLAASWCGPAFSQLPLVDERQCPDWFGSAAHAELKARFDSERVKNGYEPCNRIYDAGRHGEAWRCMNEADAADRRQRTLHEAEEKAARAAYEGQRASCLNTVRTNQEKMASEERQRKAAQEHARRQEELERQRQHEALAQSQRERDEWNRQAAANDRLREQAAQRASQQAAEQAAQQASIQREHQARIAQAQAEQAQRAAEVRQSQHDLQMDSIARSNDSSRQSLADAEAGHTEIVAQVTNNRSALAAVMAKARAEAAAARQKASEVATTLKNPVAAALAPMDAMTIADAAGEQHVRTVQGGNVAVASVQAANVSPRPNQAAPLPGASPVSDCSPSPSLTVSIPAEASVTQRTETEMFLIATGIEQLERDCRGHADFLSHRESLMSAYRQAQVACDAAQSGGRLCSPTKHF